VPVPPQLLPTTFDVYRPFGAASPLGTGHAGRLASAFREGRPPVSGQQHFTHVLDCQPEVDVRDGCSRSVGADAILYGDGDEVRIPDAAGSRYVVVWVDVVNRGTARAFKRVWLMRHEAVWPGP
jgi:hypothetical protein